MSDLTDDIVVVEDKGTWAIVTLNRPEKRNAFNMAMMERLMDVFDELLDKRVIVMTGAGAAFTAGMDLSEAQQRQEAKDHPSDAPAQRQPSNDSHLWFKLHDRLRRHPAIFIAAVNGYALGGGSTFINNCELAVAAESAVIGTPEIGFGQFPNPSAAALIQRVLPKHAAEIIFLAKRVDAQTAYRMGIVNEVVPVEKVLERASELAEHISQFDDVLLDWAKRAYRSMINASWEEAIEIGHDTYRGIRANRPVATGFSMRDFVAGGRSSGQGT